MGKNLQRKGSCLCGKVTYSVAGEMRDVMNCHCGQCLKSHGVHAAYTKAKKSQIVIRNSDKIVWYRSSSKAKRGFCGICGSSLFWSLIDGDSISIAAGSLEQPTGLKTTINIFTQDAGDYYSLDENLDCYPQSYYKS